jgi:hypothetical protein
MQPDAILVGLLAIAIGGAWAFYGLAAFTLLLPIWAFAFGFIAGAQFSQDIFGQGFLSSVFSWVVGIVVGLGLAAISYFWYYAAVTIAAGALGYAFGVGILDALGIDSAILGIVVGLAIGGVLAVATFAAGVPVFLIVAFSAISGAAGVVNGVLIILGRVQLEDIHSHIIGGLLSDGIIAVVAWIVLSGVAIAYQLRKVTDATLSVRREAYRF